jgi:hypothetical protein
MEDNTQHWSVPLRWTDTDSPGDVGYQVQRASDQNFTQGLMSYNLPPAPLTFTETGLSPGTYYYHVLDNDGTDTSNCIRVTVGQQIDSDSSDPCAESFNGGTMYIAPSTYVLTLGSIPSEADSVFTIQPVDIREFQTDFTLTFTDGSTPPADGISFVLQSIGPTALGSAGGGEGYAGIHNSIAVKFDIYTRGTGMSTTGLFTNGQSPDSNPAQNVPITGIDLRSGDPMSVQLTYDGTTLTESVTDTVTSAFFTHAYTVTLLSFIHAETAFAGFTGGTGALTVTGEVQDWTYTPTSGLPPLSPTNLAVQTVVPDSSTTSSATINWVSHSFDEDGFSVQRSSDGGATYVLIATVGPGTTSYIDGGLAAGTYYYRVQAFNGNGSSNFTNVDSVIVGMPGQTTTVDHTTNAFNNNSDLSASGSASFAGPVNAPVGIFAGHQDVGRPGDPATAGSATFSSTTGAYTLTASGSDIWDTADHLHYVFTPLLGDGSIIARLVNANAPDYWTKAGLMIRIDLTPASANDIMLDTPNATHQEPVMQWRDTAAGPSGDTDHHDGTLVEPTPIWLRLDRTGNTFTGYWAVDNNGTPGPWTLLTGGADPHTTVMPTMVYVGLALTAHNNGAVATATFDHVSITGTTGPLPATVLRLTDGGGGEAGSAFTTSRVGLANFTTTFNFRFGGNAVADGMCFVLQGVGPTALGPGGGGLGYGPDNPGAGNTDGIHNSVAIKFDLFSNAGEGNNSTGIFFNGDSPTVPQPGNPNERSIDLTGTGIDQHSQDVFQVTLSYNGTTLTETIMDTVTQATFITMYTVDIVGAVGGTVGYAGFTGGTGGGTTIADVQAWTYSFTEPAHGPAPRGGHSGGGLGLAGLSGALGLLPGALGSGNVAAGLPAGGHSRGLAPSLLGHTGPVRARWQGGIPPFTPVPRGEPATEISDLGGDRGALDPAAVDFLFSRL